MFLVLLVAYTIELISAHIFFSSVAEKKYKSSYCFLIGGALFATALIISIKFRDTTWLNMLTYILIDILYAFLCFTLNIKRSIFYGFIVTLIGVIWEVFINFILISVTDISAVDILHDVFFMAILTTLSRGLLFTTILILSRFIAKESSFKVPLSFFIFPVALMISLSIFYYICAFCGVNSTGQIALAIISLILIVPTILLFLIYQRNIEKENELFRLKNEMDKVETEKTYYGILDKQNQDLRIYAHDAKNHLAAIRSLNTDPQIEDYLNKITESLTTYSKVSRSGNHSLDVIINRYVTECSIKDVKITFDTRLKNLEYVEGYDLVTILGNLLDNALESAEKSEKREITLSTDYRNTYDVLIITNSCDTAPKSSNEKLLTTKKDKKLHGIGIKSVMKTLAKYNGDYDWEYDGENKVFTATVMMSERK